MAGSIWGQYLLGPKAHPGSVQRGQWTSQVCLVGAEPLTAWRLVGGVGLFAVGTAIAIKALHDNPFFRGDLIAPPFRITTGLYQYFDHPGYLGFALRFLGVSFIANNGMSVGLFFAYMLFLLFRADIENELLADL